MIIITQILTHLGNSLINSPVQQLAKDTNQFDVVKAPSQRTKVKVISDIEAFYALKDDWNSINSDSSKSTVFVSWEWLYTWWEVYENDGERHLYILVCEDQHKQIIGIAPFQIVTDRNKYFPCNKQLVLMGTEETDGCYVFGEYMDLLIQPEHESTVITAFSGYLINNAAKWDGLKFHELLDNSHLAKMFSQDEQKTYKKTLTAQGFRTIIDLPETYKDYLMNLRKKMRNNITRNFKHIEKDQDYRYETITDVTDAQESISILANLNRSRRDSLAQASAFDSKMFEQFHKRLVARLLPKNNISLRVLRFSDQPVAALYSFVDGAIIHPYQSGFEAINGKHYSLMTTMLTHEIEASINNPELSQFDLMYSDEESTYKQRYSGRTETMYQLSFDKPTIKYAIYCLIHGPIKGIAKKIMRKT